MFNVRIVLSISLVLSSIALFLVLNSFYASLILLLDLLWLATWLKNQPENVGDIEEIKRKWTKERLILFIFLFFTVYFFMSVKLETLENENFVVSLLACFPIILLSTLKRRRESK